MTAYVYIVLLTGIFCTAELLLRSFGLIFPFCALFIFYTATAFGTGRGILCACLGALTLDFIGTGASHPWSLLIFAFIAWMASFWLNKVESESILLNFLPGLAIPFLVWVPSVLFFAQNRWHVLLEQFPGMFPTAVISGIWLPVMIFLLDMLNEKLALPLYTDAKMKRKML